MAGNNLLPKSPTIADFIDNEGFLRQGRKGKKGKQGGRMNDNLARSSSADKLPPREAEEATTSFGRMPVSATAEFFEQGPSAETEQRGAAECVLQKFEQTNPFWQLEKGEFMADGGPAECAMEEDPAERGDKRGLSKPSDKGAMGIKLGAGNGYLQLTEGSSTPKSA